MKINHWLVSTVFILVLISGIDAQTANAWGYNTGYGTVYGSFGLAQTMQSMYNVARAQSQKRTTSEPASRTANGNAAVRSGVQPQRPAKNYGAFVPDQSIDTGKAMAEALGDTADERTLIRNIYAATKTGFEKEAAARGWKNNIAGGMTFFTIAAVTIYHDTDAPTDEAVQSYYDVLNATLDEIPEFKNVSSRDKQNFNNMTVGFGGLLLAGYTEGKQSGDAEAVANYRKLAGMLIKMVLKTEPENIRVENGRLVLK